MTCSAIENTTREQRGVRPDSVLFSARGGVQDGAPLYVSAPRAREYDQVIALYMYGDVPLLFAAGWLTNGAKMLACAS